NTLCTDGSRGIPMVGTPPPLISRYVFVHVKNLFPPALSLTLSIFESWNPPFEFEGMLFMYQKNFTLPLYPTPSNFLEAGTPLQKSWIRYCYVFHFLNIIQIKVYRSYECKQVFEELIQRLVADCPTFSV